MRKLKLCILVSILALGLTAHGQLEDDDSEELNPTMNQPESALAPEVSSTPESAPREEPYVTESKEFEEFDNAEKKEAEVLAVPSSPTPAPAPSLTPNSPVVKSQSSTSNPQGRGPRVEKIAHPLAAKGLTRIEADGTYVYKTKISSHDKSATVRFGVIQPPNIQGPGGLTDFKSMYSENNIPIVMFDYEWQPFTQFGRLGIQAGFGFFTAQGNGRFVNPDPTIADDTPQEKYTFLAFPVNLGVVYRLEWMRRQWVAPYVSGGGTYFAVAETRDDNKAPKLVGSPGAYGAGGLMINITSFDRETAFTMDSEYGISNLWLSGEYRYVKSFNEDLDFTSGIFNLGISADF